MGHELTIHFLSSLHALHGGCRIALEWDIISHSPVGYTQTRKDPPSLRVTDCFKVSLEQSLAFAATRVQCHPHHLLHIWKAFPCPGACSTIDTLSLPPAFPLGEFCTLRGALCVDALHRLTSAFGTQKNLSFLSPSDSRQACSSRFMVGPLQQLQLLPSSTCTHTLGRELFSHEGLCGRGNKASHGVADNDEGVTKPVSATMLAPRCFYLHIQLPVENVVPKISNGKPQK